ncbi:MAG: DMT family transporter [Gemmatimonadaceae bacterium]|nr:DMT family transporter [Gemmatimonadaceae bacterium]
MSFRETLSLFALAAIWGASYLFIRVAVPALGPLPLAGGRVALAALVLFLGLRLTGAPTDLRPHWRKLLVLGGLNAALPFSLISAAELHVTASLAAMLTATAPMWSALFSALWLDEPIRARRAAGLALGVAGVGVLVGWSPLALSPAVLLSILAVIVATASYAGATVYSKRHLSAVPAPTLALGQQVAATTLLALPALVRAPAAQPTAAAITALVALAVVCTAVAYLIFFRLLATIGPTRVSTVTYLIPVFGTVWGALFLHEQVSRGMMAGLVLILVSVLLVNGVRLRLPRSLHRKAVVS